MTSACGLTGFTTSSSADAGRKNLTSGSRRSLTLLQLNDSHAYLEDHQEFFWSGSGDPYAYRRAGGYARLATMVKSIRQERPGQVLFCDCGDTIHGTYAAEVTKGAAVVPVLNALGLDVMTPGNWEWGFGNQVAQARMAELKYPVLACNIFNESSGQLQWEPYTIKEINGLRVGIIGASSPIVATSMAPVQGQGARFELPPPYVRKYVRILQDQKVDLIVVLSHFGLPQDIQMAKDVPGIDVILSGHTHDRLFAPVIQGKTIIIQSGFEGSFLGRLDLEVAGGQVVDYRHQLLEVATEIPPDPEVEDLIRRTVAPYQGYLNQIVGETATPLNRMQVLECTTDDLITDALREFTGTEIAYSNGWRFGAPIAPGPILMSDLYNQVPMAHESHLQTSEQTGRVNRRHLEFTLHRVFSRNPYEQSGGFLDRTSGLAAMVKPYNPDGDRVEQWFINGQVPDPERLYSITCCHRNGDGPDICCRVPGAKNVKILKATFLDALLPYLKKHSPVSERISGRFVAM